VNVRKQFTAGGYPTTATFHCTAEPKIALTQAIKIVAGAVHSGNAEVTGEHLNCSYRPTPLVTVCKQKG